jgi:AraC-like DNA-binding protein
MRPAETVQINGIRSARLATYLYPLPAYAKPYGVVLFQISEASFGGIVQNALQNYRGDLYIFDADKELIYSHSSGETGLDQDLSALDPASLTQTVSTMSVGGNSLSLIRLASEESGWTYLIALPTKRLLLKVQHGRNVFNYTAVAVLLLGLAMSFGLAANNYGPLRKLATELKEQVDGEPEPRTVDEIAYLSRAIGEVANERRGLMARLDSRTGMMKEQVLLTLLKGKTDNPELLRQLFELSAVKLDKPYFAVLLFSVDDYQTFQQANSPPMRDLYLFCIINVVEELAKEIGSGYAVDLIDNLGIVLVLNLDADHREERFIRELAAKARDFIREAYKFTITIGVGNTYDSLARIRKSYLEAMRASYYRLIRGNDQTIFYIEVELEQETKYRYPAEQEEQLVLAIRQGKSDEAESIITAITGEIIRRSLTPEAARIVCFGIIHTVMRTLDEMDLGRDERFAGDILSLLPRRFETVDILEARVVEYCRQVCDFISNSKESKNFALRDSILAYVETNFREPSLDLKGIAAQFQLSPSYLTRLIKDQTGTSLIRYVDALRMEAAKRLLQSTDLPTKQIVTQVGYVDESNFLRKFKKKEGVTPMQFRSLMKGKA